MAGQFSAVYRVLAGMEESGRLRRGYFVEHLGGSQFALPGAVDELRRDAEDDSTVLLAATDPANPYGAALAWPSHDEAHRPGRKAGAVVILVAGRVVLYLERGGRTALSFTDDPASLRSAAHALADAARAGTLGRLSVARIDGADVLDRVVLAGPVATAMVEAGFGVTPRGLRTRMESRDARR